MSVNIQGNKIPLLSHKSDANWSISIPLLD